MKKFASLLILAAIFLFAASGEVAAAGQPFSNKTEVYYEVNLSTPEIQNALTDAYQRLQQVEMLHPYFNEFNRETGIDLEKDVFSWLGNNIMIGIVGLGNRSTLGESLSRYIEYLKDKDELRKTSRMLREIRYQIEDYMDSKEKLPDSLSELELPDDFKPPRGGKFIYRKLEDDQFEITVPAGQFKDLGLEGESPKYSSTGGMMNNRPKTQVKFEVKDVLASIQVVDSVEARRFFKKLEKISDLKFEKKISGINLIRVSEKFSYTFKDNLVLISDNPEVLVQALETLRRPDKSINTVTAFKDFLKNVPTGPDKEELLFVNLQGIGISSGMLNVTNPTLKPIVDNLYYACFYACQDKSGIFGDLLITTRPGARIPVLEDYFSRTTQYQRGIMPDLPSDLPLVVVYNVGEVWNLLNTISQREKNLKKGLDRINHLVKGNLDMDLEQDIINSTTGEIAISYKIRDFFLAGFLQVFKEFRKDKMKIPGTSFKTPDIENASLKSPRKLKKMLTIKNLPVTLFFDVQDRKKIDKLLEKLGKNARFEKEYYRDGVIYKSDKISYCFAGDLLLVHTTPVTTVLKKYMNLIEGKRDRLVEHVNYSEFIKGVKGRVLVTQYQDIEWAAAMGKGFLLLMLPECEPYAEKLGKYRQSWSAFSVMPNGVQIHYRSFKEE